MGKKRYQNNHSWDEKLSKQFIDYGRFFVPNREEQIEVLVHLLPLTDQSIHIVELCCGEGLLAERILKSNSYTNITGFDGSIEMLNHAAKRLKEFEDRFQPVLFDLAENGWREMNEPVHAVVSSLAIHHLDGSEKASLFKDVYKMLVPGGGFFIADIIDPVHPRSKDLAAKKYDQVVRRQSIALEGNTSAFEFFQREGWNIFHSLDPEDIDKPSPILTQLEWLVEAGFEKVDVFWLFAGHAIFGGWKPEHGGENLVSNQL